MTASATERDARDEQATSARPRLTIDFSAYEAFQNLGDRRETLRIVRWFECFARCECNGQ